MPRLNQLVAVESDLKSATQREITEILHTLQKPDLFLGFTRTYTPVDEEDERLPPESHRVQANAQRLLERAEESWTHLLTATLRKDTANQAATAPVFMNGSRLMDPVPVTFLLFLEKRLIDMRTLIEALPELDPADRWMSDGDLHRTDPKSTVRTKKTQKGLVLYPATDKHPAQTQVISEDVVIGHYETVRQSGAVSPAAKRVILVRVTSALRAVKQAREQANQLMVPETGQASAVRALLGYVFAGILQSPPNSPHGDEAEADA